MNRLEYYLEKAFTDILLEIADEYLGSDSEEEDAEIEKKEHFIRQTLKLMKQGYRVALISPDGEVFK